MFRYTCHCGSWRMIWKDWGSVISGFGARKDPYGAFQPRRGCAYSYSTLSFFTDGQLDTLLLESD